jgi:hypothetical protein
MRLDRRIDERYRVALRATEAPTNPHELALWRLYTTNVGDDAILRVVDIYEDTFERELLQAWIVAGATDQDLIDRVGIPLDVVAPYRHLCCDPKVFRDKLELLRWVKHYPGTKEGKLLLERAVHLDGVEAVADLCGLPSNLDAAHVNEQVMRATYFRGMGTLRGSHISSREAAEAHSLLKSSLTSAAATLRRGAPNLTQTLLKLKYRELTFSPDEVVPRGDIMGTN